MVCFTKATWLDSEPEAWACPEHWCPESGVWRVWRLPKRLTPCHKLFHPLTFWQISGCSLPSCCWGRWRGAESLQTGLQCKLIPIWDADIICVCVCLTALALALSLSLSLSVTLSISLSLSHALVFVFFCRSSFTLLIFRSFFASPVRLDVVTVIVISVVVVVVAVAIVVVVVVVVDPWGGRHLSHFVCA